MLDFPLLPAEFFLQGLLTVEGDLSKFAVVVSVDKLSAVNHFDA